VSDAEQNAEQNTEALLAAVERPYHERVSMERDGLGQLAEVHSVEPETPEAPQEEQAFEQVEPFLTAEQRLQNLEGVLGPAVLEAERQRQLTQYQALVGQAHSMSPEEFLGIAGDAASIYAEQRLGLAPADQTAESARRAEEIAIQALGEETWNQVRQGAIDLVASDGPGWVEGDPRVPQNLGAGLIRAARASVDADYVRQAQEAAAEAKRQAQTMSGAGVRPAPQNDAEAYVESLYEFARNEPRYGN
jgi:hypothetical protein